MTQAAPHSPFHRALDLTGLDPHLERCFDAIPPGHEGVGRGGFDVVGRSRRLTAMFSSSVDAGALRLRSVELRIRVARHWLRVPPMIAPLRRLAEPAVLAILDSRNREGTSRS